MADLTNAQVEALKAHAAAKQALDLAKEAEMNARNAAVLAFFPNGHVPKGTHNFELGGGFVAKFVGKLNFKVDLAAGKKAISDLIQHGPKGQFIAERLFKWSLDISVGEYGKLAESEPELFRLALPAITSSPGTPTIEIAKSARASS